MEIKSSILGFLLEVVVIVVVVKPWFLKVVMVSKSGTNRRPTMG